MNRRRSTHLATVETRSAFINTDFGLSYAMKIFGLTVEEIESIVGRNTRGKRKGELRGQIVWRSCTRGGWVRTDTRGYVVKPGARYGHQIIDPWTGTVLWDESFQRYGWIPGETRAQYDARQAEKAKDCDQHVRFRKFVLGIA